jgi:hypothetical protein
VGDHIYSDVYQSKKASRWRTMLVITELEAELLAAAAAALRLERIRKLMEEKETLELQVDQLHKKRATGFTVIEAVQAMSEEQLAAAVSRIRERIGALDTELGHLIESYNAGFNPHWGELMWAGNDKSYFGETIERYACMYASKVSNLLHYSPTHYFRPPIKSGL